MKRGWIVLLVSLFIVLGAILWELGRAIPLLIMFAMQPRGQGCDEGPVTDRSSANARGDVVEEYERVCTGFGTIVDYSIVLQLRGDEKTTKLVEHDRLYYEYPKFRWRSDEALMIDLGKVTWIGSAVHKVAGISITYVYSMGE